MSVYLVENEIGGVSEGRREEKGMRLALDGDSGVERAETEFAFQLAQLDLHQTLPLYHHLAMQPFSKAFQMHVFQASSA